MKKVIVALAATAVLTSGCAFWDAHKPGPGYPGNQILPPLLSSAIPHP